MRADASPSRTGRVGDKAKRAAFEQRVPRAIGIEAAAARRVWVPGWSSALLARAGAQSRREKSPGTSVPTRGSLSPASRVRGQEGRAAAGEASILDTHGCEVFPQDFMFGIIVNLKPERFIID